MKTKFQVDIHANSNDNSTLLQMIALHNEGLTNISLSVFTDYVTVNNAKYTVQSCLMEVRELDAETIALFSGGKHILTIQEKVFIGSVSDIINFIR